MVLKQALQGHFTFQLTCKKHYVFRLDANSICVHRAIEGITLSRMRPYKAILRFTASRLTSINGLAYKWVLKHPLQGHFKALYEPQMMSVGDSQGEVKKVPLNANFHYCCDYTTLHFPDVMYSSSWFSTWYSPLYVSVPVANSILSVFILKIT